jgi:hypothetical protein
MSVPSCPNCGKPVTRVLDAPYGWWEWRGDAFVMRTAANGTVDVSPWVHYDCMGELRDFHPQDFGGAPARAHVTRPVKA